MPQHCKAALGGMEPQHLGWQFYIEVIVSKTAWVSFQAVFLCIQPWACPIALCCLDTHSRLALPGCCPCKGLWFLPAMMPKVSIMGEKPKLTWAWWTDPIIDGEGWAFCRILWIWHGTPEFMWGREPQHHEWQTYSIWNSFVLSSLNSLLVIKLSTLIFIILPS